MSERGNSMGPHAGHRPPCMVYAPTGQDPMADVPIEFPLNAGQEPDENAESVADHEGRDRFALGQDPSGRMIRPWRKDKVISACWIAEDRIAGCA